MAQAADRDVPRKIQSYVLFDTETTGLPSVGNNPRITELCFLALTRDELETKNAPVRAINKLCLCFNPKKRISRESTLITGLHNDSLEQLAPFKTQASLMCQFLQNLPQPACLVAHNGNRFDFPLLVSHLKASSQRVPEEVLCADSLEAFRAFDGLPPLPEFVQKQCKDAEARVAPKPAGFTCTSNEIEQASGSWSGTDATKQNLSNCKSYTSSGLKRELEGCEKEDQHKQKATEEILAYWEPPGLSTPAKKVQKFEPDAPTKRAVSPQTSDMTARSRQNLFQTLSESGETSASKQTLPPEDMAADSESKFSGSCELTETGNEVVKVCPNGDKELSVSLEEEKEREAEESSPQQNLSSFPSLSDDSEQFLLEAVQQAETALATGGSNSISLTNEKQEPSHENEKHETNGTPSFANLNNSVALGSGKGCADSSLAKTMKLSYSLPKLYERVFGQLPQVSHTAEDDCQALLHIIRNSAMHKMPQWCDQRAVPLGSIPPMY
ncbi:three prime repair exonuclease 1 [Elysia marginata]|uniref:Three prime repair exonuclease 1 n=1 Tax=Elysia marginata TaxID=1093978 RepID=A0AAV4JH29_9GAST|nr:three prime repair exonuclease 1 [Elysia marginata]